MNKMLKFTELNTARILVVGAARVCHLRHGNTIIAIIWHNNIIVPDLYCTTIMSPC